MTRDPVFRAPQGSSLALVELMYMERNACLDKAIYDDNYCCTTSSELVN